MPHADAISFVVTLGLLQIIFRIVSVVLEGVSVVTEGVSVVVSVVTVKIIMLRLVFGALFFKSLYFPEKGCHLGTNRSDNET